MRIIEITFKNQTLEMNIVVKNFEKKKTSYQVVANGIVFYEIPSNTEDAYEKARKVLMDTFKLNQPNQDIH